MCETQPALAQRPSMDNSANVHELTVRAGTFAKAPHVLLNHLVAHDIADTLQQTLAHISTTRLNHLAEDFINYRDAAAKISAEKLGGLAAHVGGMFPGVNVMISTMVLT